MTTDRPGAAAARAGAADPGAAGRREEGGGSKRKRLAGGSGKRLLPGSAETKVSALPMDEKEALTGETV